jgi:hypothetical protein
MNHLPRRGDGVEAWLKEKRDEHPHTPSTCYDEPCPWHLIDNLVDRYRELADTGAVLGGTAPDLVVNPEVAILAAEQHSSETAQERLVELMRLEMDVARLRTWIHTYTRADRDANPIDATLKLLETARTAVQHLTPAVINIATSLLSALSSAGVDTSIQWPPVPTEPSLGLATTEEMLRELRARGEVLPKGGGSSMAARAKYLLSTLPHETLEYRPVDES